MDELQNWFSFINQVKIIYILLSALFPLMIYSLHQCIKMIFARQIAMNSNLPYASFFRGLIKCIWWEPNEGVIIQKNGKIHKVFPEGNQDLSEQGGFLWISILLGHELKAHIPLKDNTCTWHITDLVSIEALRVSIDATIIWKINDVRKFSYNIGDEHRVENIEYRTTIKSAAENRVRSAVETNMQTLIASESLLSINPSGLAQYLNNVGPLKNVDHRLVSIHTEKHSDLSIKICGMLNDELSDWGIKVKNVKLRINISKNILDKIDKVYQEAFDPKSADYKAAGKTIEGLAKLNLEKERIKILKEELGEDMVRTFYELKALGQMNLNQPDNVQDLLNKATKSIKINYKKKQIKDRKN